MKVLTLILVLGITTTAQDQVVPRIMNGDFANFGQFPYQAFISDHMMACGASIIHKRWLLTAAHCEFYKFDQAYAIVGTIYRDGMSGRKIDFEKFIKHKGFATKMKRPVNDIALIRTKYNLQFDDYTKPIVLARNASYDYANVVATVSGWGLDNIVMKIPAHVLEFASLEVISEKECSKLWRMAIRKKICTSGVLFQENKETVCSGDSGSPLVFHNKQIGIASYVEPMVGTSMPDVYVRVASYVKWIDEQLQLYGDKLDS